MNDVQSLIRSLGGGLEYREFANWRSPRPAARPPAATPVPANQSRAPANASLLASYAATAHKDHDSPTQSRRVPLSEVFALLERRAV
jgi:hypothetical protein